MTHGQTAIGMKIGMILVLLLGLASPAPAQVCVLPPEGLIGWWTGDVDGTDRSSNGNDALLQNGASAGVAGQVDGAFSFDGQDDIANTPLILPSIGTLDFWVNPTSLSGGIDSLLGTFGINTNNRLWISIGGGNLLVNLGDNSTDDIVIPSPLTVGQWTHLALTFDYVADVYILYVDGGQASSSNAARNAPTEQFSFGGVQSDFGQNFFLNGLIDEVEVFNRVLAPNEIQDIFDADNAGKCKDDPFSDFTMKKAEITFDKKGGTNDRFKVEGKFTLGPGNDGINLVTDEVKVTVGPSMVTIPEGSFMAMGSQYKFDGVLSGVKVKMKIKEIGFEKFSFRVKAKGIDLTDTSNPVDIVLEIGDDVGFTNVRLGGKLKLPKVKK